jgi:hypothetical protein
MAGKGNCEKDGCLRLLPHKEIGAERNFLFKIGELGKKFLYTGSCVVILQQFFGEK